ncbi:MAG: glycoside hydrolase family 127 protein [Phycisphaerae bacterium]|nr:glycoside hydrolase family 127 protein [Phycisphaerae bacterium]
MTPEPNCLVILILLGVALTAGLSFAAGPSTQPGKAIYARPFEPATRGAFIPLPPGAVEPEGYLRDWCATARDGYTGHMDDVHLAFKQAWAADYRMTGEKLFWPNGGWPYEGGGYWFDGLARLGFALHDEGLIRQAKTRFDVVSNNMNDHGIVFLWWLDKDKPDELKAAEGRHYREKEWPVWSSGLFGRALAGYYEGSKDRQALQTLESAYSNWTGWSTMEFWGVSNAWPAFQAYAWTGNKKIGQALTDMFARPGDAKDQWSWQRYRRKPVDKAPPEPADHGVHFFETTAAVAVGYLWTGKAEYLDSVLAWHGMIERDCMQPHGVPVCDEYYGPTGAFRSTETCDVSAYMWTKTLLLTITGQGAMADQVERAFFNAGPAVVSRDYATHVYFQSPNRMADKSLPPQVQCTFSRSHPTLCCTAALNRFLPNYVTHMWLATHDNGLAATMYGPCKLSAAVADGVKVQIACRTDYPFNEAIEMAVTPEKEVRFPLSLRIPGWCVKPAVTVNGAAVDVAAAANGFLRLDRTWREGDTIRLQFPMAVEVKTGFDGNVKPAAPYATVNYGPLLFALAIPDTKDANTPDPAARWNYALDAAGIAVQRGPMPARWNWPLESPLKLVASAVSFDWKPAANAPLPAAPVAAAGEPAKITLVPYGCTKLRVSMFPVTDRLAKPGK